MEITVILMSFVVPKDLGLNHRAELVQNWGERACCSYSKANWPKRLTFRCSSRQERVARHERCTTQDKSRCHR